MPSLVLMAKNTYVWLDQLSKTYRRPIDRLDQIPDEELDQLARWGFTGLWLIGLWERSPASQRIKQLCGNPDAVASAYSLYDYQIAGDLGGEAALPEPEGARLAARHPAGQRHGARTTSGIDSRWVIEHPDWFICRDDSPYPSYTFNGPDLSRTTRVGIYIEDHYYDRTDAAVVFKRVDRWTGSDALHLPRQRRHQHALERHRPAQLPEPRGARGGHPDHPARRPPVPDHPLRRGDDAGQAAHPAALVPGAGHRRRDPLARRARHDHASSSTPRCRSEFWREVVDRVAAEAPDTLLLAEAFWMMEGYFVRTLGMHRVYNSAFMNMLRDEENAKYRQVDEEHAGVRPRDPASASSTS